MAFGLTKRLRAAHCRLSSTDSSTQLNKGATSNSRLSAGRLFSLWRLWLSGALYVCLVGACSPDDKPALRVGTNLWPGYEPLYVAEREGYLRRETVKPIEFPSAVDVMRAYRNGVIDIAALTADEALRLAQTEPGRHRVFLAVDYSDGADVILAHSQFATLHDLRGHRIGAEASALGVLVLARALELSGMSVDDVQIVPLALEDHERAFTEGQVDAIVTFEPRRTHLLQQGAKEIFTSAQIPEEIIDLLVAHADLLDRRADDVQHLVDGWLQAVAAFGGEPAGLAQQFAEQSAKQSARQSAQHQGVTPEEFSRLLAGIHLLDADENRELLASGELQRRLRALSEMMVKHKLLAPMQPEDLRVDERFVSEATR